MKASKIGNIIKKASLWILGIWFGILLIIQIILLPPIFTKIANKYANDYLDASVTIGSAYGSVLRHFPRITFSVEDLEITYPHERYDSIARAGVQGHLLYSGCGETVDTLASVKKLSASISLLPLISGNLKLPHIEVDSPRIFAHSYDDKHANWNIFGDSEETEEQSQEQPADTTSTESVEAQSEEGLNIILRNISITGQPKIVYTDSQDSLFTLITLKSLNFDGNFETNHLHKTAADTKLEKLFVAGRYGEDTLAFGLEMLKTRDMDSYINMKADAKAFVATKAFGRMMVPMSLSTDLSLPEDSGIAVSLRNINTNIATIPATGYFDLTIREDQMLTDGKIDISKCRIQTVLHDYLAMFIPELKEVQTNTEVSATATINGCYNSQTGSMPEVSLTLDIPESETDYSTFPEKIYMGMNASFQMDTIGVMRADVSKAKIQTYGLGLDAALSIEDITGEDPKIDIFGDLDASLDSLRQFLPDSLNLTAHGQISADLDGSIRMSQMDMYKFSNADLNGNINVDDIILQMPDDTIDVKIHDLDITLKPKTITSKKLGKTYHMLGIYGNLANADITYKDAFAFKGYSLKVGASNSSDDSEDDPQKITTLAGYINADSLQLNDSEGTIIRMANTYNTFMITPKQGQPTIPVLTLTNRNKEISYITADNRASLTNPKIKVKANMNTIDRAVRRKAYMDSLALAHPDIPRDSLMIYLRSQRSAKSIPSWMQEEDFKKSDIKVDLNETFKKYFREWDLNGNASIQSGEIMTAYFPILNRFHGSSLQFNNNSVTLDSLNMFSGRSHIHADGSIKGLRGIMLGRGMIQMDLSVKSDSINADELLVAYNAGSQYVPDTSKEAISMSDDEFLNKINTDTVNVQQPVPSLFVLPGNVKANVDMDVRNVKYKDLNISKFTADMVVKERCALLQGTSMRSNMGGFDLSAFYSTKSKTDIRTGFCLDIKDVTSEKVIGLMPEIGELIPMIGSISGLLNCEIAATAAMDTTMSLKMPTVNGIARLSGKNLVIADDELYTSVAKMLLFRNKKKGEIKELVIEGAIKDSRIDVFPFILKLDRYTLGISGVQNLDMSYKHHISVLRSPLLIRLGLNLDGPDYDHMKFRLGKAQYRIKKMPSFTSVIDQTKNDLNYSICSIFKNGIDKTISNNDIQSLITQHQNSIGYVNAAEIELEELSAEEMKQLEDSENSDAVMENAMAAAVEAVQEVLKNN